MNTERWQRVGDIFERLLEVPMEQRDRHLESLCGADDELRGIVLSMLDSHEGPHLSDDSIATQREVSRAAALNAGNPVPRSDETAGTHIGHWRLTRKIGAGGMGVVWLAERADGQFHQRAALKLVKRGMDSEAVLARFLRERQILARLEHRNIAHLLDGGIAADGRPYFAMEYVEGEPLLAYCAKHGLKLEERLRLFLQVCTAVRFAHSQHIVHRDIKPSNILVTADGSVKLLDFGIAKMLQDDGELGATLTATHREQPMTPAYAAPEQFSGREVTEATDVYALGCVFYELLSGRRPHDFSAASNPHDVLKIILATDPVAPGRLRHSSAPVPPKLLRGDLDTIALTALQHEPERRYPTVAALAADIENYVAGRPVSARRAHLLYGGYKFLRRHRNKVVIALAALVIVILSIAWITNAKRARDFAAAREALDVIVANPARAPQDEVGQRTARAIEALRRFDPKTATAELNNVVAMSAGYGPAYMYLSQALMLSGRETDALASAQQAAERKEGLSDLQKLAIDHQLAVLKYEWSAAADLARKLLAMNPADPDLHFWLVRDLRLKGDFAAADAALEAWRHLPEGASDPRLGLESSSIANQSGKTLLAERIAEETLKQAMAQGAAGLAAPARLAIAKAKNNLSDSEGVEQLFTDAVADYQKVGNVGGEAEVHSVHAAILVSQRDLQKALAEYDLAMQAYQRIGNQMGIANVYGADATILWRQGVREGAVTAITNMLEISTKTRNLSQQAYAAGVLAFFRLDDSADDGVLEDFRRAIELADRSGEPRRRINAMRNYSEALRLRGDLELAERTCLAAQSAAAALGEPYYIVAVDLRCASIARDSGDIQRATNGFNKARDYAQQKSDEDATAEAELGLGQIALGQGNCAIAKERFKVAADKYAKVKNPVSEALTLSLLALCSPADKDLVERARSLRSAATTKRDVVETDIALLQSGDAPTVQVRAKLRAMADDAEKRKWVAYAFEARLAELRILRNVHAKDAAALEKQLINDSRTMRFDWVAARVHAHAATP